MPGGAARRCAAAVLAGAALAAAAHGPGPLVDGEGHVGSHWRVVGLPGQKAPLTQFAVVHGALRIDAQGSYGNLVHELGGQPLPRHLAWSWRIERGNPQADLRTRKGDDLPVKVCLGFDLPLERVPFVERQLLRLARARSGEMLPAATLCWVWDAHEPAGTVIDNAFTRRVRYLVVRGAGDAQGPWREESRDVAADWRAAFGDEADAPPPPLALMIGGDADNTGATTRAWVGMIRFDP